jgi:predicted class III extradiol MEMO1 family dioxygenase
MKRKGFLLKNKEGKILVIYPGDFYYYKLSNIEDIPDEEIFSSIITLDYYNMIKDDIEYDENFEDIKISELELVEVNLEIKI